MAQKEEAGTREFSVLNCSIAPSYTAVATPARRKRGPSLSRRTGQAGTVFQHCKTWDPTAPLLREVLGRYAGQSRQNTAHDPTRRLPHENCSAPTPAGLHRARSYQFHRDVPPEYRSRIHLPAAGRMLDCFASRSKAPSGETRHHLRLAGCTQRVAPTASRRQVARRCFKQCSARAC